MFSLLISLFLSTSVFAEVGKFLKIEGERDAQILRASGNVVPVIDGDIEEGDEIVTNNSIVVFYLYPSTQILLNKNSKIQITQALIEESTVGEENTSVIKLIKGIIRLQINKDVNQKINQEVNVGVVSFGVRGTDFEVNAEAEDIDLDVFEGEVTVNSPHVQTFVPEVVKANEGFRYGRKKKEFIRRKFQPRLKNNPGFLAKENLRGRWKKLREERKLKKSENKVMKKERVEKRHESRAEKRRARKKQ
jgi:hypothetical protein